MSHGTMSNAKFVARAEECRRDTTIVNCFFIVFALAVESVQSYFTSASVVLLFCFRCCFFILLFCLFDVLPWCLVALCLCFCFWL